MTVFGGLEGGGTSSKLVLLDVDGKVLARAEGGATNHFVVGMDSAASTIVVLAQEAKTKAGLPLSQPLASLGMSISGFQQEELHGQSGRLGEAIAGHQRRL